MFYFNHIGYPMIEPAARRFYACSRKTDKLGDFMEFLHLLAFAFTSLVILFLLEKLMGYRQISEMSFFDYVVGITIGSIAAEMATNLELEWWKPIVAMLIYGLASVFLSRLSQKSIKARRFISGTPIILIEKGKIKKERLKKARLDVNDLLTHARIAGYYDLSDIDYALMETTGKISFLPVPLKRPLNPKDFNFAPQRDGLYVNVIIDGTIMKEDLKYAGITMDDLQKMLTQQGKKKDEILLATVDVNKQLTIFEK